MAEYFPFLIFTLCFQKHDNHQVLDINGDGRVERHEVKQNVRMASPDASSNRESYLYEIGKFKDLVRDCNQNNENDHLITVAEGIECLSKFVREHFFFLLKMPKLIF